MRKNSLNISQLRFPKFEVIKFSYQNTRSVITDIFMDLLGIWGQKITESSLS